MAYQSVDIESSYRDNDLGRFIYDTVIRLKPKKVVEFGTLNGYSAVCIAMALKDNDHGHLFAYDLWEKYSYKKSQRNVCLENLTRYGLEDYVTLGQADFWSWIREPVDFDLLHIDISNTGQIVKDAYEALKGNLDRGSVILFEGGSQERDQVDWMLKFKKPPIYSLKDKIGYEILCKEHPSISMIEKKSENRTN